MEHCASPLVVAFHVCPACLCLIPCCDVLDQACTWDSVWCGRSKLLFIWCTCSCAAMISASVLPFCPAFSRSFEIRQLFYLCIMPFRGLFLHDGSSSSSFPLKTSGSRNPKMFGFLSGLSLKAIFQMYSWILAVSSWIVALTFTNPHILVSPVSSFGQVIIPVGYLMTGRVKVSMVQILFFPSN